MERMKVERAGRWPRLLCWLAAASLALTSLGCEDGADAPSPDPNSGSQVDSAEEATPSDGLQLWSNVYRLSEDERTHLAVEPARVVVDTSAPGRLTERQPGDVLLYEHGEGFWRRIEEVQSSGGQIIYQTRQARLTEVVQRGEFVLEIPSSGQLAQQERDVVRVRRQNLGLNDVLEAAASAAEEGVDYQKVDSFRLEQDLGSSNGSTFANQEIELSTEGALVFEPGYKIYIKVSSAGLDEFEFSVFGDLTLDADWVVAVNEGQPANAVQTDSIARDLPLCSGNGSIGPLNCQNGRPELEFSLLGMTYKFYPKLTVGLGWEGGGSGRMEGGFEASGYIKAQYHYVDGRSSFNTERPTVSADADDPDYDGQVQMHVSAKARLSFVGEGAGAKLLEAVPFEGRFDMDGYFEAQSCRFSSKLEMSGHFTNYGFPKSGSWPLYDYTAFDLAHDVSQLDDCSFDNMGNQLPCGSHSDCPDDQLCGETDHCVSRSPMRVALQWSEGEADLTLFMEDTEGRRVGVGNPDGSNDGRSTDAWKEIASSGGDGNSFGEVIVVDRPRTGEYDMWVENASDLGSREEPIRYSLFVTQGQEPAERIRGYLAPEPQAKSVKYRYQHRVEATP